MEKNTNTKTKQIEEKTFERYPVPYELAEAYRMACISRLLAFDNVPPTAGAITQARQKMDEAIQTFILLLREFIADRVTQEIAQTIQNKHNDQ